MFVLVLLQQFYFILSFPIVISYKKILFLFLFLIGFSYKKYSVIGLWLQKSHVFHLVYIILLEIIIQYVFDGDKCRAAQEFPADGHRDNTNRTMFLGY
jgi:hypothetical protein